MGTLNGFVCFQYVTLTQQSLVLSLADAWWKVTVGTLPCIVRDPSKQRYHLKTCFHISLAKETHRAKPTYKGEWGSAAPTTFLEGEEPEYSWTVPVRTESQNPTSKWWLSGHWMTGSVLIPRGNVKLMGSSFILHLPLLSGHLFPLLGG